MSRLLGLQEPQTKISYLALAWSAAGLWMFAVVVSFVAQYQQLHGMYQGMARTQAKAAYEKDIVFRRWATQHGGVYAPIDSTTPPNPYLSHIPERDVSTPSGKKLTLINPAYMMRQTYAMMGPDSQASGHITSLKPLRPENGPDPWEREALEAFAKGQSTYETILHKQGEHRLRYMKVLYVEKGCLKCHASQGYHIGDVRGGIAVNIPLNREHSLLWEHIRGQALRHLIALLVGWMLMGIGYFFVRRHFMARKAAEEKLRTMVEEQESVIHAFSHDIRTPMVTLGGFSTELGNILDHMDKRDSNHLSAEERSEIREQIHFIQEAVGQLRSLQDGILGYTRLWRESLELQKLDVQEIWQRILESRITIIGIKKAQIHTGLLPTCHGDGKAMELLLSQLLDNSLKFTPEGQVPEIRFEGHSKDEFVVYSLSDQGIGIPAQHRNHVFELFHRLNPQHGFSGSGLGLSVVKFLVQRMGGQVELSDGPNGKGLAVQLQMRR